MNDQTSRDVVTRESRRAELNALDFKQGAQGGALMNPQNGRELMDMANLVSGSDFMVRDFYRGNSGACAALIMLCQPYGMNPFQVSWKTYKAAKGQDAPISFEAQLVNAMVNTAAPIKGRLRYSYSGEGATRRCKVVGIERETGEELEYETPEIGKIKVKNSPLWTNDPDQQLGYFAARSWARRHFPEMLLGVYARDEIDEARGPDRARDVTPQDYQPLAEKLKAMQRQEPQRAPETVKAPEPQAEVEDAQVVAPDASQGFPGAAEYDEGARAFQSGADFEDNPHEGQAADDWAAG